MNNIAKKHVFVGMSGGVDSTVAVKILLDQGYQVTGITFVGLGGNTSPLHSGRAHLFKNSSRKCCSTEEVIVAKNICYSLGINHITLDLAEIFLQKVRKPFVQSFLDGETPNPCMLCNRDVKLGALIEFARANGADYVAMGHYTGVERVHGEYLLKAGKDNNKDQSYFLALLKPEVLPYLIFPLANKTKLEIKNILSQTNLPIDSNKPESQDICFVDNDFRDYLKEQGVSSHSGHYILEDKIVGSHQGTPFYALGQRRGLGIAIGKKVFVRHINPKDNILVLGEKPQSKVFRVTDLNIFSKDFGDGEWLVQTRYRSSRVLGMIKYIDTQTIEVILSHAQEIVSPGQFAVFYKNNYIYGAGRIKDIDLL